MTESEAQKLLRELERHGWQRVQLQDNPLVPISNRASEIWEIASTWPPLGLRAWLAIWNFWSPLRYGGRPYYREGPVSALGVFSKRLESNPNPLCMMHAPGNPPSPQRVTEVLAEWRNRQLLVDLPGKKVLRLCPDENWSAGQDIRCLLELVSKRVSERKLRLFACACYRHIPFVLDDENNLAAIAAEEQYADGQINKRELRKVRKSASMSWLTSFEAPEEAQQAVQAFLRRTPASRHGELGQLLCEVIFNPWQTLPQVKPAWLRWNEGTVAKMVQTICEEGRFEETPIVADALEEAGCNERRILDHLRSAGPHVRGCWALDLLEACATRRVNWNERKT